ncbi:fibrinogen C domain-containing protein 1-A-like isoform X2 [Clavelina lepadiformis]|uniref:fibrinogen C domain-containing protein 1-A-like isoform X2 n=1 Tax=Clavelina lepadiformis TaxID=159417 RepID=UPI004041C6B9
MAYAEYSTFSIGPRSGNYVLTVNGYTGNASDSFTEHNNRPFSTKDQGHDNYEGNCAQIFYGAWWYRACHTSNRNGYYLTPGPDSTARGIDWKFWKGEHYSMA